VARRSPKAPPPAPSPVARRRRLLDDIHDDVEALRDHDERVQEGLAHEPLHARGGRRVHVAHRLVHAHHFAFRQQLTRDGQ
jgi:hypothetical protein